jgi:tetratricopeptide (TPR) repeat protein
MVTTGLHIGILTLFLIAIFFSPVNAVTNEAAQDLMNKGWEEINAGDTSDGIQSFRSAFFLVHDDDKYASEILFNIGAVYYMDEDFESAIAYFDQGLELNPEDPRLYFYKGKALKKIGKNFEAEDSFNKAASLDSYFQLPFYERFPLSLVFENFPLIILIVGFSIIGIFFVKRELKP